MLSLLISSLALFSCAAAAPAPALSLSVSQKGMDYAVGVAVPILVKKLGSVSIPDFSFDSSGFKGKVSSIGCGGFSVGSAKLASGSASGSTGSASLVVSSVSTSCKAHWQYELKSWPHWPKGSGSVSIDAKADGTVSVACGATSQGQPHLTATTVNVHIDITNLHFSGGLSGDILNLFKSLIKDKISSALQSPVKKALTSLVDDDANKALASFSLLVPLPFPKPYDISEIDFSLVSATSGGAGAAPAPHLSLMLHGEAYHRNNHSEAPGPPVGLPPCDADLGSRMAEVLLHPFAVESLGSVYVQAGMARVTVTSEMIPSSLPIKLNTSTFATIAPGLAAKYPDKALEIVVGADAAPKVVVAHDALNATVPASFAFNVVLDSPPGARAPAFTVGCPLVAAGNVAMAPAGNAITAKLSLIECDLSLSKNETGGTVDVANLNALINFVTTGVALPAINKIIEPGFPLPTISGVSFQNAAIGLSRGDYIAVSTDVHYAP